MKTFQYHIHVGDRRGTPIRARQFYGPCNLSAYHVLVSLLYPITGNDDDKGQFNSLAFILYTMSLALIHLYCTSGRNATARSDAIEMARTKWYSRVRTAEDVPTHVIGDDDDA